MKNFKKNEDDEIECVKSILLTCEEFSKLLKLRKITKIRTQMSEIPDSAESKGNSQSNCKRARNYSRKFNFPHIQTVSKTTRVKILQKMEEAILEVVSAYYFKKFQSNFELVVTEKIPIISTLKMYASKSHFKSEFSVFSVESYNFSLIYFFDSFVMAAEEIALVLKLMYIREYRLRSDIG